MPQTCCLSPVRPSLTPSRQSPAKKSSSGGHFSKTANGNCVSLNDGEEKLNLKARITNSALKSRRSPDLSGCSPRKNKMEGNRTVSRASVDSGYQQPTVSSRTRALSPYTHRKMCQLSEDTRQRLSHLQLGPHYFRKETEPPQPFLVCNTNCILPN